MAVPCLLRFARHWYIRYVHFFPATDLLAFSLVHSLWSRRMYPFAICLHCLWYMVLFDAMHHVLVPLQQFWVCCILAARVQCQRKWRHVLPCMVRTCNENSSSGGRKCCVWILRTVRCMYTWRWSYRRTGRRVGDEPPEDCCNLQLTQWHIWIDASVFGVQLEKWVMF